MHLLKTLNKGLQKEKSVHLSMGTVGGNNPRGIVVGLDEVTRIKQQN